jgi:membrane protease YdiL (CAAX protease family)
VDDSVLIEDTPTPLHEGGDPSEGDVPSGEGVPPVGGVLPGGEVEPETPRWARWVLAGLLLGTYIVVQLVVIVPVLAYKMASGEIVTEAQVTAFVLSETGLGLALAGAALGAVCTIGLALAWSLLSRQGPGAWIAWRKPLHFKLWLVPLLTVVVMVIVLPLIALAVGEAEVETQMLLFSTGPLQVASTLVVTTVVPFAEEFIFRGAFYNAVLPKAKPGVRAWQRHLAPFLFCSLLFAAIHIPTGFLTAPSIIMILMLSFFLTALRAWTGSVRPSILAHMIWNLFAAVGLILENVLLP